MIKVNTDAGEGHCEVRLSGWISRQQFDDLAAQLMHLTEIKQPFRILFLIETALDAESGVLWDEIRFGAEHGEAFDRIAIVGHERPGDWIVDFATPFVDAEVRWFGSEDTQRAREWLAE